MHLTRHTDYALRVLVFVGLRADRPTNVRDVAAYFRVSHHHLLKVVKHLAEEGFVTARRGRGGGIALARDARDINIADVVRKIEPTLGLVECQRSGAPRCRIDGPCTLDGILGVALGRFLDELAQHSLADVIAPMRRLVSPNSLVRAVAANIAAGGSAARRVSPS